MSRSVGTKALLWSGLIVFLAGWALGAAAQATAQTSSDEVRAEFERRYQAWRTVYETDPHSQVSSTSWGSPAAWRLYRRMIELGPPVLPWVMERMAAGEWRLKECAASVTGKGFAWSDYPDQRYVGDTRTKAAMLVDWWYEGRKDTPQQFARLHEEWRAAQREGRSEDAQTKLRALTGLGIAALPQLVEKAKAGETELVPVISRLTRRELAADATPQACAAWWEKRRDWWTLPPVRPRTGPASVTDPDRAPGAK